MGLLDWITKSRTDKQQGATPLSVEPGDIEITFDKKRIQCKYPQSSKPVTIKWKELTGISIECTSAEPSKPKNFWVLFSRKRDLIVFPCGAVGESEFLMRVQQLEGFDDELYIKSVTESKTGSHMCWQLEPVEPGESVEPGG